jgi:hypothetical protein
MNRINLASGPSRRPLCAGIASLLALSAPAAFASSSVWPVTTCGDSGAGSLRDVIGAVTTTSGDTVDLSGLANCVDSKISLSTGEIFIMQDDLTILGPGRSMLTIDGTNLPGGSTNFNDSRIFTHKGTGTLTVQDVRLTGGHSYHTAGGYPSRGGCIYSTKNVTLQSSAIEGCGATSQQDKALGGGVYAKGNVTLDDSIVSNNGVSGGDFTQGGGIWTKGTITATYSTVSGNTAYSKPKRVEGAGIYAFGGGDIVHTTVAGNTATAYTYFADGGGIYARNDLSLSFATITGNTVTTTSNGTCGGGAFVFASLTVEYSTIDGNSSGGLSTMTAGGGLCVSANLTMRRSTVSANTTTGRGGGINKFEICSGCGHTASLRNSTLSGNHANVVGGLYSASTHTKLYNSTIAFNTAALGKIGSPGNYYTLSPGVTVATAFDPVDVTIHSMLISNNTYGADIENDFSLFATKPVTFNTGPVNSLIRFTLVEGLPTGIIDSCPLLGPLRDNGGLTKTHALQSTSPAIDSGDNLPINFITLDLFDQRASAAANGQGDYFRVSGPIGNPTPLPDIGAYEVQQDDIVFNSAFEGCPDIP